MNFANGWMRCLCGGERGNQVGWRLGRLASRVGLTEEQGKRDKKQGNKCIGLEMKLRNRADEERERSRSEEKGPLILGAGGQAHRGPHANQHSVRSRELSRETDANDVSSPMQAE